MPTDSSGSQLGQRPDVSSDDLIAICGVDGRDQPARSATDKRLLQILVMPVNISGLQHVLSQLTLFAQEAGKGAPNPLLQAVPMLVAFMVMFYLIILRPQQKETQRRADLLNTLKKNDKVLTAGGIIGTIVEFSSDGNRVTLKVDDGTRIKFTRSSIQGPYNEKADAEGKENK